MSRPLPFFKMTGSGNDFVMFDGRVSSAASWSPDRIREVCDRRMGVGGDGLVVLTPEAPDVVRMSFWNCDGSVAAMCGNAALCSTRLAERLGMAPGEGMTLVTGAGSFRTRCTPEPWQAALNLPPVALPVSLAQVPLHPGELRLHLGTVGVPHAILEVQDIEGIDLERRGRELRFHPAMGPAGANVNFIGPTRPGEPTAIRTYERGVEAETLACGTGTVAAALALAGQGTLRLPASFKTRSGRHLEVNARLAEGRAEDVWLGGEGRLVFTGELAG
ncbi:MAG: diaminopimelate epimerase [Gemmatimonadales bacterium]